MLLSIVLKNQRRNVAKPNCIYAALVGCPRQWLRTHGALAWATPAARGPRKPPSLHHPPPSPRSPHLSAAPCKRRSPHATDRHGPDLLAAHAALHAHVLLRRLLLRQLHRARQGGGRPQLARGVRGRGGPGPARRRGCRPGACLRGGVGAGDWQLLPGEQLARRSMGGPGQTAQAGGGAWGAGALLLFETGSEFLSSFLVAQSLLPRGTRAACSRCLTRHRAHNTAGTRPAPHPQRPAASRPAAGRWRRRRRRGRQEGRQEGQGRVSGGAAAAGAVRARGHGGAGRGGVWRPGQGDSG